MMVNIISIAAMNPLQGGDEWRSTWAKRVAIALGRSRSWLSHPDEDPGVEEGRICGSKTWISDEKMKALITSSTSCGWRKEGDQASLLVPSQSIPSWAGTGKLTACKSKLRDAVRYQIFCFFIKFQKRGGGVIPVYKKL